MQFSRHARNKMRKSPRIYPHEVDQMIASSEPAGRDYRGNTIHLLRIRGSDYVAIVALDNPQFLITIHPQD
jgi:hypothetical protein